MTTEKKPVKPHGNSRAAMMRRYYAANPDVKPAEVADKFNTSYQVAYMVKRKMQPKKIVLQRAEVEIANKLGIPTAEYARQKAKMLKEPRRKTVLWQPPALLPVPEPITMTEPVADPVNHPAHYRVGGIETINFIEAKGLDYNLGNVVKYITRSDYKDNKLQDLQKAAWYLNRAISKIKESA